jgi:hypothetical protein
VKFAHLVPDASDVEDSIQAARRFFEETRENAPLIDVGAGSSPVAGAAARWRPSGV